MLPNPFVDLDAELDVAGLDVAGLDVAGLDVAGLADFFGAAASADLVEAVAFFGVALFAVALFGFACFAVALFGFACFAAVFFAGGVSAGEADFLAADA